MSTLRDQIFAADDLDRETVEVPEWGVTLEVRTPDGATRAKIAKIVGADEPNVELVYPALLIPTLFDPDTGEQIFTVDDADAVNAKSGLVLERLSEVALRVSGVTQEALEAAKKG